MVDTKTPGDKTLSVSKTLTLKPRVETGTVRQSFSHGRTKQVVVEKRGKRRIGGDAPATETHAPEPVAVAPKPAAAPARPPLSRPASPAAPRSGSGVVLRTLTEDERSARSASALADAKVREVEERRIAEEEARRRSSKEGIEQAEREAAEARRKAEEDRHRLEEEAKRKAEIEAKKRFGEAEAKTAAAAAPANARPGAARPAGARPATSAAVPPARAPGVAADASDGRIKVRARSVAGSGCAMRPAVPTEEGPSTKPGPQKDRLTPRSSCSAKWKADDARVRSLAAYPPCAAKSLKKDTSRQAHGRRARAGEARGDRSLKTITMQELSNRMADRAVADIIKAAL